MRILIVEDEDALAHGLKFNFEQEGYSVTLAGDGATALDLFRDADPQFDLIILDLMLPGMSGYEACQRIRELDNHVPILVLSARTLSEDKAQAFDSGTDQYVTKPFALPELLSRVRNLIERHRLTPRASAGANPHATSSPAKQSIPADICEFGDVRVDFRKFEVTRDGETHSLTTKEQQLLRYFIEQEGLVVSRSQILEDVWGETVDVTTRTIDNFVLRLRRYIESNPAEPRHLLSVRGTGYRFLADKLKRVT